ncbi:hypothetical protein ACA910_002620 [Epithemia clementina (nom. ined.)]
MSFKLSMPGDEEMVDETNNDTDDAYHLLWSPKAWDKFLYTTAALILVPRVIAFVANASGNHKDNGQNKGPLFWLMSPLLPSPHHQIGPSSCHAATGAQSTPTAALSQSNSKMELAFAVWSNIVLPLAASACCLLQLALNLLAIGCAGWNKVLGPIRPYFMALLVATSLQQLRPLRSPLTLVGRTAVALLPEALDWYNRRPVSIPFSPTPDSGLWSNKNNNNIMAVPSKLLDKNNPQKEAAGKNVNVEEVTIEIPSMGCVACIHSINGALRQVPGVLSAQSQLHPLGIKKGGSATVIRLLSSSNPTTTTTSNPSSATTPSSSNPSSQSDNLKKNPHDLLLQAVSQAGFSGASVAKSAAKTVSLPKK